MRIFEQESVLHQASDRREEKGAKERDEMKGATSGTLSRSLLSLSPLVSLSS